MCEGEPWWWETEPRFERLSDKMQEREARFRKGNQHVDSYMGNEYSWIQLGYTIEVIIVLYVLLV